MVVAVIVPTALTASAATGIELSVPFFCQRSANVCVNACLSMTEAYAHGFGQNNDYVYETVMNFNPGAALSSSNASKLGYTSISCNLQTVYNQLAAGKPVIIQRSGHFAVIYAYRPTSTTLQKKDFHLLNPFRTTGSAPTVVGPTYYSSLGYKNLEEWLTDNTWLTAWVKTANKIPVVDSDTAKYSFSYNANGGSGTVSGSSVYFGQKVNIATNAFTKTGYNFAGYYTVKRSDGKAYVSGSTTGWFTESDIAANGYTKKQYKPGESYNVSNAWTEGLTTQFSYTFYAQWVPATYDILTYRNYTSKNYLYDSAFTEGMNSTFWQSRDTSVATVGYDTSVKRVSEYNTLKIVNAQAGASSGSKDLAIATLTNQSKTKNSSVGDTKEMILSFWAKATVAGTKMYFRWGYETTYKSVSLTTDWAYYTIRLDKTELCGNYLHPYVDKAGTVWISEMQLEDGTEATEFVNETGALELINATYEGTYSNLPTPERDGYTFDGWYTEMVGGTKITASTSVLPYGMALYAHWTKKQSAVYDVNGDGNFNLFDYVAVKAACLKGTGGEELLSRADVNGDGKVNMFDYVVVKNAYFVK